MLSTLLCGCLAVRWLLMKELNKARAGREKQKVQHQSCTAGVDHLQNSSPLNSLSLKKQSLHQLCSWTRSAHHAASTVIFIIVHTAIGHSRPSCPLSLCCCVLFKTRLKRLWCTRHIKRFHLWLNFWNITQFRGAKQAVYYTAGFAQLFCEELNELQKTLVLLSSLVSTCECKAVIFAPLVGWQQERAMQCPSPP